MRTQIGKYILLDPAQPLYGGMGMVYKAKHPDLDVPVAIKEPHLNDAEYVSEFQREAKRTAALRHPNIVEIYDADLEAGTPYLVMEFLPDSLKHLLDREKRLNWERAVEFGVQICKALTYAHTRTSKIVHRDIKPANVLLTEHGSAKVCDFGLAIALTASSSFKSFGLAGTPEYMPPEQWGAGDLDDIDGRADIYALGITLFQMIEGSTPYQDNNPFLLGKRHESEPLPEFIEATEVPQALKELITKATAKDPNNRYQTADALREALESTADTRVNATPMSRIDKEEKTRAFEEAERALTAALRAFDTLREQYGPETMDDPGERHEDTLGNSDDASESDTVGQQQQPNHLQKPFADVERDQGAIGIYSEIADIPNRTLTREFLDSGFFDVTYIQQGISTSRDTVPQIAEALASLQNNDLQAALSSLNEGIKLFPNNLYLRHLRGMVSGQCGEYRSAVDDLTLVLDLSHRDPEALNNRGRSLHLLGDYQSSIRDFDTAISIAPESALIYRNRGDSYDSVREYDLAIRDLTEAIRLWPDGARSFNIRGVIFHNKGEPLSSIEDYTEAIRLDPELIRAHNNRGAAYRNLEEYQKAIDDYTEAIRIDPENTSGYRGRARVYRTQKKYQKAIDDCTEGIRINPGASLYRERARSYRASNETQKAIDDYTESIRLDPHRTGYNNRGVAYHSQEEYQKAIDDYTEAIRLDPEYALGYRNRGESYCDLEEYQKAVDDYTEAIRLDPEDTSGYRGRARVYRDQEEYQKAIDDFTEAIRINPEFAETYYSRGYAYRDLEEYQKAIDDFTEAIRLDPEDTSGYRGRARVYRDQEEYQKAIDDFTEAIRINPEFAETYYSRGYAYRDLEEYQKAIDDFTEAITINPEFALPYYGRGICCRYLEEYQKAVNNFTEVISLDPENVDCYRQRGDAYWNLEEYQRAIDDYTEAIRLDPGDSLAYFLRGWNYGGLGQHQLAVADYTVAIEIDGESEVENPEKYSKRAESHLALKEYQSAVDDYSRAIGLDPQVTDAYRRRGAAYLELGEIGRAIQDLEEYDRLQPNEPRSELDLDVDRPEPNIPEAIGRYQVSELISESGLSMVYKGYHPDLGRNTAIRVPPSWAQSDFDLIQMYETEAKLLARMQHPNIVTLYEYHSQDGEYVISSESNERTWSAGRFEYTVMEYLPNSLADQLGKVGALHPDEAILITIEICKALEYIHRNGLLHGDIRPAHILIGDNTEVKLTSFLLTKQTSVNIDQLDGSRIAGTRAQDEPSPPSLDLSGVVVTSGNDYKISGTPCYMPPELWRGDALDGRSDIYSLGVTLFEISTGTPPFNGESMEIFRQHQNEPIPPMSRDLNITQTLYDIVRKAMEKDADDRFHSAMNMRLALEAALG